MEVEKAFNKIQYLFMVNKTKQNLSANKAGEKLP